MYFTKSIDTGSRITTRENTLTENTTQSTEGRRFFTVCIAVAAGIVLLDQLTKWAILQWVPLYDKLALNSFINITHQQNPGAAFSFLADASGWQRWFFTALAVTVSAAIVVWLWRIRRDGQYLLAAGLALVLGGALGNVIDRIRFGYVVDFIQVLIVGWPFPSFNVADSAITVGAALLIVDALFFSGKQQSVEAGNSGR